MDSVQEQQAIEDLTTLHQLQHLSLHCGLYDVRHGAAVWQHLPALHELIIESSIASMRELQRTAQHLAALTQLTKLAVEVQNVDDGAEAFDPDSLVFCKHLTSLTRLRDFSVAIDEPRMIVYGEPLMHDAQHLTALTALTSLRLIDIPTADAITVALLALRLTNLEHLEVSSNSIFVDSSALPAIGTLTKLKSLVLSEYGLDVKDAQRGLLLLTGLTGLTQLVGLEMAGNEALREFWAMIMHA